MIQLLVGAITPLLDKFIPDADEKARIAHELATMTEKHAHELAKGQLEVNKVEAAHKSLFVAGWRPAVGWVCVTAMAFHFIAVPVLAYMGHAAPNIDDQNLMTVLLGMLGLGGMRTFEKTKQVAREK